MSEDVFSQLRRLVRVEDEVRQLQESILHQGQREEPTEGAAVLLLRELQKELKKLKMESRRTLSSVCDDQGFMTLVPLCEKLLQHQVTAFGALQSHLSHYGYTAPATADNEEEKPAEETAAPSSPGSGHTDQQLNIANTPATKQKMAKEESSLDRTPTLEDFGLSESRMAAILTKNIGVFKEPPAPSIDPKLQMFSEYRPPASIKKWSSSDSIPDAFKNAPGIAITPGLFNGRSICTVTPGKHLDTRGRHLQAEVQDSLLRMCDVRSLVAATTVFSRAGRRRYCRYYNTFNSPRPSHPAFSLQSDSGDDYSPQPPIFTTPGVKQLYKPVKPLLNTDKKVAESSGLSRDTSPAYPVFNTPGLNKLWRPDLKDKVNIVPGNSSSDTSPAYPDFTTPGFNKISNKTVLIEEDHTPDAPEFCTPHLKDRLQAKLTYTIPTSQEQSSIAADEDSLESPQLTCTTNFMTSHTKLTGVGSIGPAAPRLVSQSRHEDLELPDTPEFTFKFTNFTRQLQQNDPQVTKPEVKPNGTKHISTTPVIESSVPSVAVSHVAYLDTEDDDLPPEPELTCNFSKQLLSKPTMPTASVSHTTVARDVKPEVMSNDTQNDVTTPEVEIVKAITCDEYVAQPSWVQRQLSLEMLEKSVKRINSILSQKIKEGKALTLNEKDVAPVTLSFVLVNTKRILVHRATSLGTTYSVIQRP